MKVAAARAGRAVQRGAGQRAVSTPYGVLAPVFGLVEVALSNDGASVNRRFTALAAHWNRPWQAIFASMHLLAAAASALALSGFTLLAPAPDGGRILVGTIPGTPRPSCVYLPPGYDGKRRYPVVYLLHGLPGSPSEYVFGTRLGEFADAGITSGKLRPFIAVMPPAGQTAHYGGEWAGPWERELLDEVVPWVDSTLPTIASARGRVIAGLSAGGYGAVDIALRNVGVFGTAESWSGYFTPLRDGPFRRATAAMLAANDPAALARTEAPALRAHGLRFFVSTGPFHSARILPSSSLAFARELRSLGLTAAYRAFPLKQGEWRNQLDAGLDWALTR
jgi:enterochelin esterase-like enzyme